MGPGRAEVAQSQDHCTEERLYRLFAKTNKAGTLISCATPKTCYRGVHYQVRNTAPIPTQAGELARKCAKGCFLEVFLTPHWGKVHG